MRRLRSLSVGGRLLVALAVGGALFGIATAVQAVIPDSGTINACYYSPGKLALTNPRKGALRVIDTSKGQTCAKDETALSWNAAGVTGAQGATGPTGATGATGATGPTGLTGASGASAFTGRITGIPTTTSGLQSAWGAASGLSASSGSEAAVETVSPSAAFTAQDFYVEKTGGDVPSLDSISVYLVVNGRPQFVCAIGFHFCSGSGTTSVPADSSLSIEVSMDASNGAIPGYDLLFGWRATG